MRSDRPHWGWFGVGSDDEYTNPRSADAHCNPNAYSADAHSDPADAHCNPNAQSANAHSDPANAHKHADTRGANADGNIDADATPANKHFDCDTSGRARSSGIEPNDADIMVAAVRRGCVWCAADLGAPALGLKADPALETSPISDPLRSECLIHESESC